MTRIFAWIAFLLTLISSAMGALTLPQVAMLPASWQPWILLAVALLAAAQNFFYILMDWRDNGKLDKSYKIPPVFRVLLLAGLCLALLPSCATRADGTKTFLALDGDEWMIVGGVAGRGALQGALQSGLPAYQEQRQKSLLLNPSGKTAVDVVP